ncbi:hypothetical protein OG758_01340 [Streptomyces sp. NBC_01474]|uniref:hypothetical protein n=1 Tax=unclassified Streptomyces TaxID=2593676 RepID=UPI002DDC33D9|nr:MULTISPECIES: hypothetical protein [unclassified Streptomyces]WSD92978.1 hypothetical protein OG758_01340 [Streptomyces sp. NBC_01474]
MDITATPSFTTRRFGRAAPEQMDRLTGDRQNGDQLGLTRIGQQGPSMKSKIAVRAEARLGQAAMPSNSRLMVAKKDSARALSQHCPVRPAG